MLQTSASAAAVLQTSKKLRTLNFPCSTPGGSRRRPWPPAPPARLEKRPGGTFDACAGSAKESHRKERHQRFVFSSKWRRHWFGPEGAEFNAAGPARG